MKMKGWFAGAACAAALMGFSGVASAQCAGFTDISSSDTLTCEAADWVRNRSVTAGCGGGGTLYCPLNEVTRAQMAIFMKRLGNMLSPTVLRNQGSPAAGTLPLNNEPATLMCITELLQPASYPRQVVASASVSLFASDAGAVSYRGFVVSSNDGGTSWANLNGASSVAARSTAATLGWGNAATAEWMSIPAGAGPYRFAVGIRRDNVLESANSAYTALRCQITASVTNAPEVVPQ